MEKAQVEREIVRIYLYEYLRLPNAIDATESPDGALKFYEWLENHHSEVLEYHCHGDKYQDVAGMVEDIRI